MRKALAFAAVLFLGACQDGPPLAPDVERQDARGGPPESVQQRFIVTLEEGAGPEGVARDHGLAPDFVYREVLNGFAGSISQAARDGLMRDRRVRRVERDGEVRTMGTLVPLERAAATYTQDDATWGLDRIDQRDASLDGAYRYAQQGYGVTAYIVDTGIRYSHDEFGGRATFGFDVLREDGSDCHGHGTHVAGTVAGATYGVAKAAELVSVRVLQCSGAGTISGVIAGLDWIGENAELPAVANLSLGASASESLDDALKRLVQKGVTVAVAAGNAGEDACDTSPARVPEALTLGATDRSDTRSSFSNHGSCVDLFAPGERITSAYYSDDDALARMSGTSMSAPHAAGAAALYLEAVPGASPAEVGEAVGGGATQGIVIDASSENDHLLYSLLEESEAPPEEGDEEEGEGDDETEEGEESGDDEESGGDGEEGQDGEDGEEEDEPSAVTLTAEGYKVKGRHHVDLAWTGAEGSQVRVLLDDELLDLLENTGAYTYATDGRGKGTYTFQVCEEGGDACSEAVTVSF